MSSSVLPDGITVYVYARTDVGMKRQGNEDSFLIADLSSGRLGLGPEVTAHQLGTQGSLMIVSDGLGGAAAGEVASAMAVQTVCTELMKSTKSVLSPNDRLKRATEQANEQIWACAQSDNSLRGMGATLTAAFIYGNSVYIAQVGDSRAYIVRDRRVKQVTEDQSWANAVKKAGLDVGDVPNNVILQALGTQPKVHVEVTSVDLLNGDVLLLCSDGLSNKIKDLEMREIANSSEDLAENCRQFIELANKRGGEDNITVVLARFVGKSLLSGMETDLSITSTFKVVTPLDFGEESLDENETMSFQGGQDPKKDTPDPMAITQNALLDAIPTLSNLPALPNNATSSKEPSKDEKPIFVGATSPLGSDLGKAKNNISPNTAPFSTTDIKPSKAPMISPEKAAFRLADTKTDLPVVPVFDLSKEPAIEPKREVEKEINIEFVPTPVQEPRISSSSILAKSPNQASFEKPTVPKDSLQPPAKPEIIALPPKPSTNIPVPSSSNPGGLARPGIIAPPSPPIAPPKLPPIPTAIGSETKPPISLPPIAKTPPEVKAPMPPVAAPVPTTRPSAPVPPSPIFSSPGATPPITPPVPTTKPSIPVPTTRPSVPVPQSSVFSGPGTTPPAVPPAPTTKPNSTVPPPPLGAVPKPPMAPPPPIVPSGLAPPSADAKPLSPPPLPMPPVVSPAAKGEVNPVSAPLGGNLFAPPPKPTPAVTSGDKQGEVPRFAPPPATLPSTPLNLFAPDANSAALPPPPKPAAPSPLSAGSLFAPPPKASSPNAPKVDDFLDNALFSPTTPVPPKPIAPPPPAKPPIASRPSGENSLENSLFTPPPPRPSESPDPMLGVSSPGLIFPEAFKEKNAPPPVKTLDDEPDPIMLETLSVATPQEPRDFKPDAKLFAPPVGNTPFGAPSPMPPLVPPPIGKIDPNKPAAAPLFAPPSPNKAPSGANPMAAPPPPINTLPPPIAAKTETGQPNDPKSNRTGVEVLASLFSAPAPNKPAPTTPTTVPNLPPPPVKGDFSKPEVTKDPLKPAPPALVLPPSPKKADIPPVMAPPPLKPSIPAIAPPPPMAAPPKPLAGPMAPPPTAEDKGIRWGSDSPSLGPGKVDTEKKVPLFSPPPSAPNKPVNLPPPPGPAPVAKTGIPPVTVPPAKIDLPPAPKPSPAVNLPPAPAAKQSPPMPPPPVASKPSSFDEESALIPPPVRTSESTAFSEVSTETPSKKESQINPKLILALGGVVVFIVTVGIVIFMFLGKGKTTQTANTATPTPVATTNPETTPEPVPSPVATTKPQPSPSPVQASEPPIPKDTPGLVKYSLEQLNTLIDRAQRELPDSDPAKEVRLRSLKAFRDQLSEYVTKNIADDNARNYAETALSQVKGVRAQLDALPKSGGNKGGKKK